MSNKAIETIFDAAVQLDGEKRDSYLDSACGGDPHLRQRVQDMILAQDRARRFFAEASAELNTHYGDEFEEENVSEGPGEVIGRYKLLQKLGEGGMGVVYMAEQTEPVTRKVALKIIKLGMDTKSVVARFEAERQALAMMDHPNIAKVLDAGATDAGRPFFVMELVRGVPITEYCDKNKLSTQQRLELFLPVCQAIQHAHHKGVIHRDIKPSNVMVTLNDGVPHPMVIDFGIAKAVNQKLTEKTLFTNYAQMIGTPAYVSPEQAEMSKLDVDTRTDVYSLGVLLYELLTGTTPFPAKELLSVGYGEMQRIISEQEPPRPSTRMSTMQAEERTTVAKNRNMEISALGMAFKGDLDWIVMKALEKDRTHRYDTVNGLASDIQRHLQDEPVSAVAPTFGYQLRKFARRNRKYARAAAVIAILLVTAALIASWQALRATSAKRIAEEKREEAELAQANENLEKQRAEANAEEARSNERRALRLLYASDMRDARAALAREDRDRAIRLLETHIPAEGGADFRGWEWRYLWAQSRGHGFDSLAKLSSPVHSLSVSHDGRLLAVGRHSFSAQNALTVVDLKTKRPLPNTPEVAHGRVRTAFSPTKSLLAFNLREREDQVGDEVVLWDANSSQVTHRFSIMGSCEGLQFSSDGRTLFVANVGESGQSQIEIFDTSSNKLQSGWPASDLGGRLGWSESFTTDSDGNLAAYTTNEGKSVVVMDLTSGEKRWSAVAAEGEVISLALSPDGRLLASCGGYGAESPQLWDARTGERLGKLIGHRDHVKEFVFWPDGQQLATAGNDQTIRVWDLADPRRPHLAKTLLGHRKPVWQLALGPDKRTLLSGALGGQVLSWNLEAPDRWQSELVVNESARSGAWFFETGERSAVLLNRQGQVVRISGQRFGQREVLFNIGTDHTPHAAFSANRRFLGVGYFDGRAAVWDVIAGEKLHEREIRSSPVGVLVTRNDGTVLLGATNPKSPSGSLEDWDLAQSTPRASAIHKLGTIPFGAESGDAQWLIQPHDDAEHRALLVNQSGDGSGGPVPLDSVVHWAGFSEDGSYFATDGPFQNASVFETATRRRVLPISDNLPQIRAGAFSPDNRRFATGGQEATGFNLWDLRSGQIVLQFPNSGLLYSGVRYSGEGNLIGAQSPDRLHLWRAPSWEEIQATGERDSLSD